MAENSKIEWTDHTFNPWIGCTKISPACDHCYAETWDQRYEGGKHWGAKADRRRTGVKNWNFPLKWEKMAKETGVRKRVFCASLADVFDNHRSIDPAWREDLFRLIKQTPNLDWLLLTKRPQNIAKMLPTDWGDGYLNVWLGTTVENQEEADRRIPVLQDVPAFCRFLSCEPLLNKIDVSRFLRADFTGDMNFGPCKYYPEIDWIIAGGESGPESRPSHPDWFRSLRDQAIEAGTPFLFKQWGDWKPDPIGADLESGRSYTALVVDDRACMVRIGKEKAGRELDGKVWDQYPIIKGR